MKKMMITILLFCMITAMLPMTSMAQTGDVLGYAKYTDISAYINHYPVTSYNINNNTAVIAEDLANYGFNVVWNGETRSLSITKNDEATQITPYGTVYKYSKKAGQNSFPYLQTDIVTYVNGTAVESFNINGKTCIYIDSLAPYGEVVWVPEVRAIKVWLSGLSINDYVEIEEAPITTLYAKDGRSIDVETSEVEAYLNVGWYKEPVHLAMSSQDVANSNSVNWIHQRSISYYKNENLYRLFFGFKNSQQTEIYAPCLVDIKIINDDNELVYSAVKRIQQSNFANWTQSGVSHYLASIEIPVAEITKGTTESGKVYFTITNDGYFNFSEYSLSMYDLPKIKYSDLCSLQLPQVPKTLHYYDYKDQLDSTFEVTNIQYKFEDTYNGEVDLILYFDGLKTFDKNGAGQSSICKVGWKLYDDQGYVVEAGTFYSPAISEGEKYRNEDEKIYYLEPGAYVLEILDTNEK